jgi:arginine:ornithine antiporter/lysine permease
MSTPNSDKMPLATLIAMVVGGMVGAGVFSIPRNFAMATGVYGAVIAWIIAGAGMLMLAFVFQTLANRKPDLDAVSRFRARRLWAPRVLLRVRYRASAFSGVSYWILIKSTLGVSSRPRRRQQQVLAVAIVGRHLGLHCWCCAA